MGTRDAVDRLLFGRDTRLSIRLVWVASALFVVSLFAHLPVRYLPFLPLTGPGVTTAVFLAMFLVAAGAAYLNDGLFVAVAIASGIGIGFYRLTGRVPRGLTPRVNAVTILHKFNWLES